MVSEKAPSRQSAVALALSKAVIIVIVALVVSATAVIFA